MDTPNSAGFGQENMQMEEIKADGIRGSIMLFKVSYQPEEHSD